ncbi:Hpt domain-containing protein [Thalassovita taeanensis]|uniref:Hpt domain-containing protein n=1 Tax=Thalassovita taeanensis TaxID=657014 RepID=A0A1H9I646_9RHOB|nr:Hpt domain-containing protein [Thalassovita taeanensis]SEQ69885.1 Hpt domain-containing protein [Thalassovita taeanensis]
MIKPEAKQGNSADTHRALFEAKLAEMRPRFAQTVAERLTELTQLRDGPSMQTDPYRALDKIRQSAHKTAGMATPMGFAELGRLCIASETSVTDLLTVGLPTQESFAATLAAIDDMLNEMARISAKT